MPDMTKPVSQTKESQSPKDAAVCLKLLQAHLKERNMFSNLIMDEEHPPDPDNLANCLKLFTSLDVLDEDNKFICDPCTDELRKSKKQQKVCFEYVCILGNFDVIKGWRIVPHNNLTK